MKLTITNETRWQTRDLRAFIAAGLRAEGVEANGHWRVRVCYLRGGRGSSGYASYNSTRMCLRLPNPVAIRKRYGAIVCDIATRRMRWVSSTERRDWMELPDYDKADLAHTLWHEVAHCRGIKHGDMEGGWCGYSRGAKRSGPPPAWAAPLVIRAAAPKPKPTKDERVSARLSVIEDRLVDWRRKLKLARTKVRKYEAAHKRAGLRLAALRPPEAP